MSRAGCNRKTALATLTMTLAAEAADLDMLWYFKGSAVGFAHHRGFTHTLIGAPVVAAFVVGAVWLGRKLWQKWKPPAEAKPAGAVSPLPIRWGWLYLFACLAAYSHILLDFTNSYGVRLFWPFSSRWYSWDIVFIVEPAILVVLIAGLVLPSLFSLVNQEIGARQKGPRGRGGAITALVLVVLIWGLRDYEHRRAVYALASLEYQGAIPNRVAAYPYEFNPFRWYGVVETDDFYEGMRVDSLGPEVDPQGRAVTYYKPTENKAIAAAKETYLGRVYLDWAQFPIMEVQEHGDPHPGYTVIFRDLRFMYPGRRESNALAAYVDLDPMYREIGEGFLIGNPTHGRMEGTASPDQ